MILSAKKRANQLANKFISKSIFDMDNEELKEQRIIGKSFALICVNEIVTELNKLPSKDLSDLQYWSTVEHEINLL